MKRSFMRGISAISRQRGQGMTEYIIIVALIAIAAIAAFTYFGHDVRAQVGGMAHELSGKSSAQDISNAQAAARHASASGSKEKTLGSYTNSTAK